MVFIMFDGGFGKETPVKSFLDRRVIKTVQSSEAEAQIHTSPDKSSNQNLTDHKKGKVQRGGQESGISESVSQSVKSYVDAEKQPSLHKPARFAGQIMTSPVVTVASNSHIEECLALFHQHRFRHLPVIDGADKIIGMISDRDFLLLESNSSSLKMDDFILQPTERVMNQRVLTATKDTEISAVASVMVENRIGAIPIVNSDHNVVGIVTRSDILRQLINHAPLDRWM